MCFALLYNNIVMNLNEANHKKMLDNIKTAIETNKESAVELLLTDNEINTEYIRTTVRAIAQTYDRYLFYCVIVNITKQKNAEERELEYAQQLKIIMDNVNGGVSAIVIYDDGSSKMIFNNEKFYELYGYTNQEAIAENLDIFKLIFPEDLPYVMQKIKKLKQDKKPTTIDYRCIKRDGKIIYMRSNSSLMHIQGYGDEVITSVTTDVTEEKTTSERLKLLTNNIPGGIVKFKVTSKNIRILYLSDGFYKLTGYSKKEYQKIANKNALHFIFQEDMDILTNAFNAMLKSGENIDCAFRINTNGGNQRWVNLRGSLSESHGNSTIIDGVLFDITKMKLAEEKIRKAQDKARLNYARELNLRKEMIKDCHVSLVINLTSGFIEEYNSKVSNIPAMSYAGQKGEDHCRQLILHIDPKDRERIRNTIFPAKLLESYNRNQTNLTVEFRRKTDCDQYHWVRANITIAKRPDSDEIIAFLYIKDIDMERKNQMAIKSILDKEIESAGILNVSSGLHHLINVHDQGYYIEINKEFDYDTMITHLVNNAIIEEDREQCCKSMMCQSIKSRLDTDGTFVITFHVKNIDGTISQKQTAAFYLDETHEDLVISTCDITNITSENQDF